MPPEFHFGPVANEFPETFWAIVVGFILLLWLSWRFGMPLARSFFNDRANRIEEAHRQLQQAMDEVQGQHDEYLRRLREIEVEARAHIDAAVREAEATRAEIIADAASAADAVRRRAGEEIEREQSRARLRMRRQIVEIVLDAAEAAARMQATEQVQRSLINDFVTRVALADGHAVVPVRSGGAPAAQGA